MALIQSRPLGQHRHVRFIAAQIDVVAPGFDLLIAGMPAGGAQAQPGGGASQIDLALHGTLAALREREIFSGSLGDMLTLSTPPPPVHAAALMLVGMGAARSCPPATFGCLTARAMRAALRTGVHSVGCLLAWSGQTIPDAQAEATAMAMMRGALGEIDAQAAIPAREPVRRPPMVWTFDIRNGAAEQSAAALRDALLGWPQFR